MPQVFKMSLVPQWPEAGEFQKGSLVLPKLFPPEGVTLSWKGH